LFYDGGAKEILRYMVACFFYPIKFSMIWVNPFFLIKFIVLNHNFKIMIFLSNSV